MQASERRELHALWLGTRPYAEVYDLQVELMEYVKTADHDVVLLLEHEPCITLGRGAHAENLLAPVDFLAARGISVVNTNRGGDVTLHAPGQLVAYPIVNLNHGHKDVRRYVKALTAAMGDILEPFGLVSGELPGKVGLWVDTANLGQWTGTESTGFPAKIAAIGVRISRWITMHGFALNLVNDLGLFQWIVPCGIRELPVTSLGSLIDGAPNPRAVAPAAQLALAQRLNLTVGRFAEISDKPVSLAAITALFG